MTEETVAISDGILYDRESGMYAYPVGEGFFRCSVYNGMVVTDVVTLSVDDGVDVVIYKANYWRCVLVAFIMGLLTAGAGTSSGNSVRNANGEVAGTGQDLADAINAMSEAQKSVATGVLLGGISAIIVVSLLLRIFLFNPIQVGGYRFFKRNLQEPGVSAGVLKEGFGGYGHTFITLLLRDLFLCLWSFLFVIPGIIKAYSYRLVPYLIKDNPELSATETITLSRQLMHGHKGEAFLLDLSFIGWYLLGFLTLGLVNLFWTAPYHESAKAEFYLEILQGSRH